MIRCSLYNKLQVTPGMRADYESLASYHYRDDAPGVFTAVYVLRPNRWLDAATVDKAVGVIVYTMPVMGLELRNIATAGVFAGFDRATRMALVNGNIRCISRVIIEPRFRGLGLASRLVTETMPLLRVPIIEAMAVMGQVNPFFEKAGMRAFHGPIPARHVQLIEAFGRVGIEDDVLIDPPAVQARLNALPPDEAAFIESQIRRFLQSYGRRRTTPSGLDCTRYILSKLTDRPTYYIWFNPTHTAEPLPCHAERSEASGLQARRADHERTIENWKLKIED